MPQLQNVVLTDRATPTPVAHTFTPRDIINNVGTVVESMGVPIGEPKLTVSLRNTPSGKRKGRLTLTVPVVQTVTINGVSEPTVVRYALAELDLTFDRKSTEQERADLMGLLHSALASDKVLINDTFVKLQGVY